MFYQLGEELWFSPDKMEMIEVLDLGEVEREFDGVTLISRGDLYMNEKSVRSGGSALGLDIQEEPPKPPEGPREWDPRVKAGRWTPPPPPGQLLWTPEPARIETIIQAYRKFQELSEKDYDTGKAFSELEDEEKDLVMEAAEAAWVDHGFDGGANETVAVIDRDSDIGKSRVARERFVQQWRPQEVIVSRDRNKAEKRVLKKMGVLA